MFKIKIKKEIARKNKLTIDNINNLKINQYPQCKHTYLRIYQAFNDIGHNKCKVGKYFF